MVLRFGATVYKQNLIDGIHMAYVEKTANRLTKACHLYISMAPVFTIFSCNIADCAYISIG